MDTNGFPWVSIADLKTSPVYKTAEKITRAGVRSSSVHLVKAGTPLMSFKLTIGRVAVAGLDLYTNEAIVAVNGKTGMASNRWLFHSLPGIASGGVLDSAVKGKTLNKHKLEQLELQLPSLPEQRRIAEILDTADEAIQSTERLIAKLEQTKQGLLHDLLERCVNGADGQRKARMVPLGDACDLQVGFAFRSEWFREDGEIRLLRGENAGYGVPNWADTRYLTKAKAQEFGSYLLEAGDIIIGMDRAFTKSGFKVSKIAAEDTPSLLVQRVGRFQPHGIIGSFLWCILNSETYQSQLALRQIGMDIPHLSKADILSPVIPMPEVVIQQRIAETFSACEQRERSESRYLAGLLAAKGGLMDDLLTGRTCVGASV